MMFDFSHFIKWMAPRVGTTQPRNSAENWWLTLPLGQRGPAASRAKWLTFWALPNAHPTHQEPEQ